MARNGARDIQSLFIQKALYDCIVVYPESLFYSFRPPYFSLAARNARGVQISARRGSKLKPGLSFSESLQLVAGGYLVAR